MSDYHINNCCGCHSCPDTYVHDGSSLAPIGTGVQIDPLYTGPVDVSWGCVPAGTYQIWYCGGAWQYYGSGEGSSVGAYPDHDWVVTRAAHNTADIDSQVPGFKRYWFVFSYYNAGVLSYAVFPEPEPPSWGYTSAAAATAAIGGVGAYITLNHSGGPIGISFRDNIYSDNVYFTAPKFALIKAGGGTWLCPWTANITAGTVCGTATYDTSGAEPTAIYHMRFTVHNSDGTDYTGVYARVLLGGGITYNPESGPFTLTHGADTVITVDLELDHIGFMNRTAVLQLRTSDGKIKYLTFDITPHVVITNLTGSTGSSPCAAEPTKLYFNVKVTGLPVLKLWMIFDYSSSGFDSAGYYDSSVPICQDNVYAVVMDDINCDSATNNAIIKGDHYFVVHKKNPASSTVTAVIKWQANGTQLPPGSYTWTGV